ncbi:MAG: hypothetical protein PHQ98_02395 [Candidatus ainarchaeum sp.]|nr:hypothetical protein [Candidatus ainarchaeum sp.]
MFKFNKKGFFFAISAIILFSTLVALSQIELNNFNNSKSIAIQSIEYKQLSNLSDDISFDIFNLSQFSLIDFLDCNKLKVDGNLNYISKNDFSNFILDYNGKINSFVKLKYSNSFVNLSNIIESNSINFISNDINITRNFDSSGICIGGTKELASIKLDINSNNFIDSQNQINSSSPVANLDFNYYNNLTKEISLTTNISKDNLSSVIILHSIDQNINIYFNDQSSACNYLRIDSNVLTTFSLELTFNEVDSNICKNKIYSGVILNIFEKDFNKNENLLIRK